MAYSSRTYTPGSSTTTFALTTSGGSPIGYIRESDIEVKVNGAVQATSAYSFSGTKTVEQPSGGSIVLNSGVTGTVILSRTTAIQDATVVYTAGSTLTSTDLNNADNQIRFGLQEFSDDYASLFTGTGDLTGLGAFIGGSDAWASSDAKAATTAAIDGQIDAKATAKVKDDIIATAPVSIADDSPSAGKITISVDAELTELATMSTGTAQALADLTGTEVQILDGCTRSTAQLNYVDATSSIQTQLDAKQPLDADLTAIGGLAKTDGNIIVGDGSTWVAENGATARTSLGAQAAATDLTTLSSMQSGAATELASLTSTELDILDGCTRTTAQLNYVDATSSIQTQLDAKQPLDAELTELATMSSDTASALADLSQAEVQILDDATVNTAELNVLDGIPATLTATELGYVDGVTSAIQTQVDAKQPLDSDLTTLAGMQAGTASILAGGTALTSTLTELNQIDGITLADTASLDTTSDTKIPTSKAIATHVSGAITAIGGFKAIAGPTNFPSTQPAQGVVVSISDVGGSFTVASQEITITNGAGTGNNVRITGFPAVLNGQVNDDTGLQVTSDINNSTSGTPNVHRYVYHKLLATETDVAALSDDINDFNSRYRTDSTGNNPSSNNDAGDLFFNQGSNTMYVRNGANNAWEEVTSSGDFKFLFLCPKNGGSGNPTFDSSETEFDLRDTSNTGTGSSVTSAAQLMVSVNGVVQKPNAGTSTSGLTGFVMLDSNTIKFCGAPVSGDSIFVIQSGSAVTLNAPANNTVATDTLQNLAVTNGKIADDTIAEGKLDIHQAPSDGKFLKYTSSNGMEWGDVPPGVGGANAVTFNDNIKANWGTNADLQVWHNDTDALIYNTKGHTSISNSGTGNISIQAKHGEDSIKAIQDGAVELYHDNTKRFESTSTGATLSGNLVLANSTQSKFLLDTSDASDNKWLSLNGGGDASQTRGGGITFFGNEVTDNQGRINIAAGNSGSANGFINFNTGGSERARIDSSGNTFLGRTDNLWNSRLIAQEDKQGRTQILVKNDTDHADASSCIALNAHGNSWVMDCGSGAKNSNALTFGTDASGTPAEKVRITTGGNVGIGDTSPTKPLTVGTTTPSILLDDQSSRTVELVGGSSSTNPTLQTTYNASLYFGTNSTARYYIDTSGHFIPNANDTYDLGSNSNRFRNIHTNDLNLSNEGSNNDVDGSWGSFTIQEGEDDLFLINRRNGKKYKFNLTEVS